MSKLITILFLCLLFGCQKELLYKKATSFDGIKVNLITDTTINSVWDGGGKVLRIEDRIIHGTGTLRNWIIDAPYTQQIVDSSINIVNCQTYNNVFSVAWLGAKESNSDNWWNIQKSINTCLANKMSNCYVSFNNCTIRYYDGLINDVYVHGGTYNNVYFGGGKLIYQ